MLDRLYSRDNDKKQLGPSQRDARPAAPLRWGRTATALGFVFLLRKCRRECQLEVGEGEERVVRDAINPKYGNGPSVSTGYSDPNALPGRAAGSHASA